MDIQKVKADYARESKEVAERAQIILDLAAARIHPKTSVQQVRERAVRHLLRKNKKDIIRILASDLDLVILGAALAVER